MRIQGRGSGRGVRMDSKRRKGGEGQYGLFFFIIFPWHFFFPLLIDEHDVL